LNEQLVEIGHAMALVAHQDIRQIEVVNRGDYASRISEFYEYKNGEYVLAVHKHFWFGRDDNGRQYTRVVRTDLETGVVTTEIMHDE